MQNRINLAIIYGSAREGRFADTIVEYLAPQGVIVVIEAEHLCMSMRGVQKAGAITATSAVRGIFAKNIATRAEAMSLIKGA